MFPTVSCLIPSVHNDPFADDAAFASEYWPPFAHTHAIPEPTDDDLEAIRADLACAEAEAELEADAQFIAEAELSRALHDLARRYGLDAVRGVLDRSGYPAAA